MKSSAVVVGWTFWTVEGTSYYCTLKPLILKKRIICGADTLSSHLAPANGGPVYAFLLQAAICLSGQSLDM